VLPGAEALAIPLDNAPWPNAALTAQDDDVMTIVVKSPSENRSDLSRSTWNDDPHRILHSVDKPIPELGTRHQALLVLTAAAISSASDSVVHAVQEALR
jgi:hypothetical protein